MKIKIDKIGNLHLERADKMKRVGCPFSAINNKNETTPCGDWCALFHVYHVQDERGILSSSMCIELCKKEYICDTKDFIDEREYGTNNTKT